MAYINKVKTLINQVAIIDKLIEDANTLMILLISLIKSYNYFMVALESMKIKEITIYHMISRLCNKV